MTTPIPFQPDTARAHRLDARMRTRLADSLSYIAAEMNGTLVIPQEKLAEFLQRLKSGPVSSLVFGAYFDLVLTLERGDMEAAAALFEEILNTQSAAAGTAIFSLGDPSRQTVAGRYQRLINTDPDIQLVLQAPTAATEDAARLKLQSAFALLERGFPELASELSVLIREIVLAVNADGVKATFDGASSFMLWGAIILNAEAGDSALGLIEGLAHESGHNLLFGLCADGPLVENDDYDRFPSPLRADPRPMDGIVHAAYIIARMHQTVHTLLTANVLDQTQQALAQKNLASHVLAFRRGSETIDQFGRLSPLGQGLMSGARDYMAPFL
jgi:hypothetical protein